MLALFGAAAVDLDQTQPVTDDDGDGFPDAQVHVENGKLPDNIAKQHMELVRKLESTLREQYKNPRSVFKHNFKCTTCKLFSAQMVGMLTRMRKRQEIREVDFVNDVDNLCSSEEIDKWGLAAVNENDQILTPESSLYFTEKFRANTLSGSWVGAGLAEMCDNAINYAEKVYRWPKQQFNAPAVGEMICVNKLKVCKEEDMDRRVRYPGMFLAPPRASKEEAEEAKASRDASTKAATKSLKKVVAQLKDKDHVMREYLKCSGCKELLTYLNEAHVNATADNKEVTDFQSLCPEQKHWENYGLEFDGWSGAVLPRFASPTSGLPNAAAPGFVDEFLHAQCTNIASIFSDTIAKHEDSTAVCSKEFQSCKDIKELAGKKKPKQAKPEKAEL